MDDYRRGLLDGLGGVDDVHKADIARIAALEAALERAAEALDLWMAGSDFGKWKAWLVEGTRQAGHTADGLLAAKEITRRQAASEEAAADARAALKKGGE